MKGHKLKTRLKQLRKTVILDAVEAMLVRDGCQNFSATKVAKAVEVGKGTLYSYESSQSDWIDAVVVNRAEQMLSGAPAALPGASPLVRLEQIVTHIIREAEVSPQEWLRVPCCMRLAPCPYRGWEKLEKVLGDCIKDACDSGALPDVRDAVATAHVFQFLVAAAASSAVEEMPGGGSIAYLEWVPRFFMKGILGGPRAASKDRVGSRKS